MMSDFASMDWDLQAVIRGWSSAGAASSTDHMTAMNHEINHDPLGDFDPGFNGRDQQDLFFGNFPDGFESPATADFFDELEGMFKPFYQPAQATGAHASSSAQLQQQPAIIPSGLVLIKQEEPVSQSNGSPPIVSAVTSTSTAAQVAKYKRRKNQQKRVVQQAKAEGLSSSDKWAWRKYGQKPIKGSPYPRSYYRCSSSKGCPARKQVEQSCADPGMYVITYTGDHNHSHPTRRNSLSGVARCRFAAPRQLSPTRDHLDSSAPTTLLSGESIVKSEEDHEERSRSEDVEIYLPDHGIVFSDDLFPSLDDLRGCIMD